MRQLAKSTYFLQPPYPEQWPRRKFGVCIKLLSERLCNLQNSQWVGRWPCVPVRESEVSGCFATEGERNVPVLRTEGERNVPVLRTEGGPATVWMFLWIEF